MLSAPDARIGEIYLTADEIAVRVHELADEIDRDYAGREPVLVGALKACIPFATDLSRATGIAHALDFVELSGYDGAETGGHDRIRYLKDLDVRIEGRDVILVDEVIDTGLTMHYLCKSFELRNPRSLAVFALFDRPYRRLVDDIPIAHVGFTVPDEFFVGYGFGLDNMWRNLPNLHLVRSA